MWIGWEMFLGIDGAGDLVSELVTLALLIHLVRTVAQFPVEKVIEFILKNVVMGI